jgi:hypothetical protein
VKKQEIYRFKGIEDLYADMDGNFFYKGKPAKKMYNNGTVAIKCGTTKRGLIKLRTLAYKSSMEIEDLPF